MVEDASSLWVVDHPLFTSHAAESPHPERPDRQLAARAGIASVASQVVPLVAERRDLFGVHTTGHEARMEAIRGEQGWLDPDTYFARRSGEIARLAAGAGVQAVEALVTEQATRAFVLVRPPGHHARPDNAMGFCLLNNIAIAAAAARARGAERVAIVDFDVHHGNGTQEIFYADGDVFFVSLHQSPLYPGTGHPDEVGRDAGRGATLNVPLPASSTPADYGAAMRRVVLPALRAFGPSLVLVSAGFDAHADDPIGGQQLDAATFAAMTSALANLAPTALFLEGGYDLVALQDSVAACAKALLSSAPLTLPDSRPRDVVEEVIKQLRLTHPLLSEHQAR